METLATRISRDGPLNELDAVGWAIRLAKRIEALHALGVAHGAVSPECVITTAVDRTSKAILADLRQTPSRVAYQSPERVVGGNLSPGDDVWAIAATLYEALTGTSAFGGANDAETRQRIATASPAPLAVFDVGDDDLQHVLDHAFQRERSSRNTNAATFRRALEEWHPDPAVRALPPLDEEDGAGDDDDDEVRTLMRASPLSVRNLADLMGYGIKPAKQAPPQVTPSHGEGGRNPAPYAGMSPAKPGALPSGRLGAALGPAASAAALGRSFDDDDEDQVMTVMRESPSASVKSGPGPVAFVPARPAAGAPPPGMQMKRAASTRPGMPEQRPGAGARPTGPFGSPQPRDVPGAARQPPLGQQPRPGPDPRPFTLADIEDEPIVYDDADDDDNARTLMREAPPSSSAVPQGFAAAPRHVPPAAGQAPSTAATGAARFNAPGPDAANAGRLEPTGAGRFDAAGASRSDPARSARFPVASPDRAPGAPAIQAPMSAPGIMRPADGAPGAAFGQQVQGHSPQNPYFTQHGAAYAQGPVPPSPASSPSPFVMPGSELSDDLTPDRSGHRGVIIAMVVAILLAVGAMLFAGRLGLLGSAPGRAPADGAPSPAVALV